MPSSSQGFPRVIDISCPEDLWEDFTADVPMLATPTRWVQVVNGEATSPACLYDVPCSPSSAVSPTRANAVQEVQRHLYARQRGEMEARQQEALQRKQAVLQRQQDLLERQQDLIQQRACAALRAASERQASQWQNTINISDLPMYNNISDVQDMYEVHQGEQEYNYCQNGVSVLEMKSQIWRATEAARGRRVAEHEEKKEAQQREEFEKQEAQDRIRRAAQDAWSRREAAAEEGDRLWGRTCEGLGFGPSTTGQGIGPPAPPWWEAQVPEEALTTAPVSPPAPQQQWLPIVTPMASLVQAPSWTGTQTAQSPCWAATSACGNSPAVGFGMQASACGNSPAVGFGMMPLATAPSPMSSNSSLGIDFGMMPFSAAPSPLASNSCPASGFGMMAASPTMASNSCPVGGFGMMAASPTMASIGNMGGSTMNAFVGMAAPQPCQLTNLAQWGSGCMGVKACMMQVSPQYGGC